MTSLDSATFIKGLIAAGMTVIWAAPQLDGEGNWLPEIDDDGEMLPTGTWNGYNFPRWKDPATRELHTVRDAEHVDILMAKDPRPAFLMLTGLGVDVIDLDSKVDDEHDCDEYKRRMIEAVGTPAAVVHTPRAGGMHLYVASSGKHNESNSHSQIDYRGSHGLIALPGTLRRVNGEDVEYRAVSFDYAALAVSDAALGLFDEYRAEKRNCSVCATASNTRTSTSSGVALGDGVGWEMLEERILDIQVDDPLWSQSSPWDLADATLTWAELLSPWFNIVGQRDSNVYLMRAEKAASGGVGKSAVLHCADNKFVAYSSDLPIQTGTQLSKLDVYCATREAAEPGEDMPEDFTERMKWLRLRWSAPLYERAGLDIPRYLRGACADQTIARAADYPTLSNEFWEKHPLLKRVRIDAEQRGASPEGTLACLLVRVLLNIGHQVVLPPKFGSEASQGATLNVGAVLVAPFGRGKGEAEGIAEAMIPVKHITADMASGQTFSLAFGTWEKQEKDEHDPHAPTQVFRRNCWSRYLQYDEMDRFKQQMGMQNSTLSPMLRTCLTSDFISERFAINKESRMPAINGFRIAFVAHGQPERLDWLLIDEATGGFPQRLWYIYAESEMPASEYLDPDFEPEPIEPIELNLPAGWQLADEIRPDPPKIAVKLPRLAKEQVRKWQWTCEDGDQRGMLTIRLKSYAAFMALLPDMSKEELWELATEFHGLSFRTHQHVLKQLRDAQVAKTRVQTAARAAEQRSLGQARVVDEVMSTKKQLRSRVLEMLSNGSVSRRHVVRAFGDDQRVALDEVLLSMENEQEISQTKGTYSLR